MNGVRPKVDNFQNMDMQGAVRTSTKLQTAAWGIYDKEKQDQDKKSIDTKIEESRIPKTVQEEFKTEKVGEEGFVKTYRESNEDVSLDHFFFEKGDGTKRKPMIVLHGILANKTSLKSLGSHKEILEKRDCYLPDMRNGVYSDHHDQWTYDLYAEDVIRFADKHGLQKFDLLGHSLGGRVAMTIACKYPDRVDGVICIDSPPGLSICEKEMYDLMKYMTELSEI